MKNLVLWLVILSGLIYAQGSVVIWNGDNQTLIQWINSTKQSDVSFGLQQIIKSPNSINANSVGYDLYKLFRNHENENIRQMALIALYRLEHYLILKNLKKDLYTEKNQKIKLLIYKILKKMPVLDEIN